MIMSNDYLSAFDLRSKIGWRDDMKRRRASDLMFSDWIFAILDTMLRLMTTNDI